MKKHKISDIIITILIIFILISLCIIPFLFLKKDMDIIRKRKYINNTIINK